MLALGLKDTFPFIFECFFFFSFLTSGMVLNSLRGPFSISRENHMVFLLKSIKTVNYINECVISKSESFLHSWKKIALVNAIFVFFCYSLFIYGFTSVFVSEICRVFLAVFLKVKFRYQYYICFIK